MGFTNLTPHDVVIFSLRDCVEQPGGRGYTLRHSGVIPLATFPASGNVARAAQTQDALPSVRHNGAKIPVYRMTYGVPVGLPDPAEGTGLIVSALTANAAKAAGRPTYDLFIVQGVVRDDTGAIIGCTGFAQV